MSIERITISVPTDIATRIKKAAGKRPVSAWVTSVIEERLDDSELERLWREFYRSVNLSRADKNRADAIFRRLVRPPRRRKSAA
jgi:hypothetical protein